MQILPPAIRLRALHPAALSLYESDAGTLRAGIAATTGIGVALREPTGLADPGPVIQAIDQLDAAQNE